MLPSIGMRIIVGGVRGTSPVAQPGFAEFGGETTALLVEGEAGDRILLDAGSGIRSLGERLSAAPPTSLALLFTHFHLDHVLGLPAFAPLYDGKWTIEIGSPDREGASAREIIAGLLSAPFWPVDMDRLPATLRFLSLPGRDSDPPWRAGALSIRWCPLHHPGGSTAYRIEEPSTGAAAILATDFEWGESSANEKEALIRICREPRPADMIFLDGQFDARLGPSRRGWGHNAWQDAAAIWERIGGGRLLLTHHDPANDDRRLHRLEEELRERVPEAGLARQGMEIRLGRSAIADR